MFGPRFADLQQLSDENAVIISESDERGKAFFREFFAAFNLDVFEYSFSRHDQLMGVSLTLPFSASIAFAACAADETVPGTTYAGHKEVARKLFQEDDYLLAEVLFNPTSLKQLERITHALEFLKHVIRAKDYEEAETFFNKLRKNLSANGSAPKETIYR
jgi:prephenate dehydrogenase